MTLGHRRLRAILLPIMTALSIAALTGIQAQAGRLSNAGSPYLLAHAADPIEWHPWEMETLKRVWRENKLIFLSIGYAACYWCHVQSRTTFADSRVVEALNRQFISILVDREERPDIDSHFIGIMLAMTGYSGYPASFILTPDLIPLFSEGYLAPDPEFGKPGFLSVVNTLSREWDDDREAVLKNAEEIGDQLQQLGKPDGADTATGGKDPRESAARAWSRAFDDIYGGFGREPKFLKPNVLSFLLHQGVRRRDRGLLRNVFETLDRMAAGGVRDQLGGAFHRYAVDRFWQIPHFEIMLDENALLAHLYIEAFQATGRSRYARVARSVLEDLLNRFRLPGGGFATSLDAESGGVEGLYYTWTAEEVRTVLAPGEAAAFIKTYMDEKHGLVHGRSVLRLLGKPDTLETTETLMADSRYRLLAARSRKPAPRRDDKVLTSWSALAISAFAKAAQVLDDKRFMQVAQEETRHLLASLSVRFGLSHSRLGDKASGTAFLDDYAFFTQALLDLYETDFDENHLESARSLMLTLIARYQKEPGTPFRFSPLEGYSGIPVQTILDEDNVPSGNAAALIALQRLVLFSDDRAFKDEAQGILKYLGPHLDTSAPFSTGLLKSLDFSVTAAREIVIVGNPNDKSTRDLLREVYSRLLRGTVLAVIAPDVPDVNERWPLLAARPLLNGTATAYVCKNRLCDLPVDTPAELATQLDRIAAPISLR